jgi:hypothetical protein
MEFRHQFALQKFQAAHVAVGSMLLKKSFCIG